MATRVFTVIETDKSDELGYHFEWYGSKLVNVVSSNLLEETAVYSFSFMDQPDLEQVVKACEAYYD